MCIAPPVSVLNNYIVYTVILDGAPGPDNMDSALRLMLVDDPVALQIRRDSREVNLGVNDSTISIEVCGNIIVRVNQLLLIYYAGRAYD